MNPAEITAWTANQERTRAARHAREARAANRIPSDYQPRRPCVVCGTSTRRVNSICANCQEKP